MVYRRKGRTGWWFHYLHPEHGRQCEQKCQKEGKRAASVEAAQFKSELARQFVPIAADDFGAFIARDYWPSQKNHLTAAGLEREAGIFDKHLGPYFAGSMRRIDAALIIDYITLRQSQPRSSRETVRKELNILKHALRIAVKRRLLARNPFDDLERKDWPRPGEKRTRHLDGTEWQRLIEAVPLSKRAAVVLLVNSGMRRGELMALEWSDINFSSGTAWAARTKGGIRTGKGRFIELTPEMCSLLSTMPRNAENPRVIWQFTRNALTVAFRRAVKVAGLASFRLHDLRHTFATTLRKAGVGIDVIAQLLGHSDVRQTQIYAHIADESRKSAAATMGEQFGSKKVH